MILEERFLVHSSSKEVATLTTYALSEVSSIPQERVSYMALQRPLYCIKLRHLRHCKISIVMMLWFCCLLNLFWWLVLLDFHVNYILQRNVINFQAVAISGRSFHWQYLNTSCTLPKYLWQFYPTAKYIYF